LIFGLKFIELKDTNNFYTLITIVILLLKFIDYRILIYSSIYIKNQSIYNLRENFKDEYNEKYN